MTIFDSSISTPSPQPFQANFREHLPPFMQENQEIDPKNVQDDSSTMMSPIYSEEIEIRKTSEHIHDQLLIECTELASEQKDHDLEKLLSQRNLSSAINYILEVSKAALHNGNFKKSMDYAYRAILSRPLELEGYAIYASALYSSGQLEETLSWLDEVKIHFPDEPSIFKIYYETTKLLGESQKIHEALLSWLKVDTNNVDAWVEMIQREKKQSIQQALDTTNKVLENHTQDPKLLNLKKELENALNPPSVDLGEDMEVADSDVVRNPEPKRSHRRSRPKVFNYPYLFNPLSGRGTPIHQVDISTIHREIWRKKISTTIQLQNKESPLSLQTAERKKRIRESRQRHLEQHKLSGQSFFQPAKKTKGSNSIHPRVRSIAFYSTEKNDELQDRKLSFLSTIESRKPIILSKGFHESADFLMSQFKSNGMEPLEVVDSMVKLGNFHSELKRPFEWRCHIIPIQRRSTQDNLIGAIIAGINLAKMKKGKVLPYIQLMNRVNHTISPFICLLSRINCVALKSNRAGNPSIHNFLWRDLQQNGTLPLLRQKDFLKDIEFQGFRVIVFSKQEPEQILTDSSGPHTTIKLLKTKIGQHDHYDLLYPQFGEEIWEDGILINNWLLNNGMSQDDIGKSNISITFNQGKSLSTRHFDVIPLVCAPEHNFYQAVIAGVNAYQSQIEYVGREIGKALSALEDIPVDALKEKYEGIEKSIDSLTAFIKIMDEKYRDYQIEDFSKKFQEMMPLLNTFQLILGDEKEKPYIELLSDTHVQLRKFHKIVGDFQSHINQMKMEHRRSFPPPAIIARKNPQALHEANLNSSSTFYWLWKELQQEGNLRMQGFDEQYDKLPNDEVPDAIKRGLANLGYSVVIWTKGSRFNGFTSKRFDFSNRYLAPYKKGIKVIHLLQSNISGRNHYDLLIPKECSANQILPPLPIGKSKKRSHYDSKSSSGDLKEKRLRPYATSSQGNHKGHGTEEPQASENIVRGRKRVMERSNGNDSSNVNKRQCTHRPSHRSIHQDNQLPHPHQRTRGASSDK